MRHLLLVGLLVPPGIAAAATPAAPSVQDFARSLGPLAGAAAVCDPALAANTDACTRHIVRTWPGKLTEAERQDALVQYEQAKAKGAEQIRASRAISCSDVVELLRNDTIWLQCPQKP